jgi:hypothetical protein
MPILDEEKSLRLSESTTDQLNLFLNLLEKLKKIGNLALTLSFSPFVQRKW